jgi:hypothetical protein
MDAVGVTAALLAAFSFAFYNVGGHTVLARYDRWKVLMWVLVATSTFWIFVNPLWKILAAHYSRDQGRSCWPSRCFPCSVHSPATSLACNTSNRPVPL